jgi:hypothetical protein
VAVREEINMAIKYTVQKLDGTENDFTGWDDDKKFCAVIIRQESHAIRNYNYYKTFAGAKSMCEKWGCHFDLANNPNDLYYAVIVEGEVY